ncbi:MAG: hypothetical protein KF691_04745 [Phycisphaeraceae bacterium]|nr:hypothetical protein [Phycisphaeraceae bacterium]
MNRWIVFGAATGFVFGLAALAAPDGFASQVQASAPSLWYRFNESPSSTTIVNHGSLGAPYNATPFSGVLLNQPTASGDSGVGFNAATQPYIESNSTVPAALLGNPTFSVEAIVRMDGLASTWAPMLFWGGNTTGTSAWFSLRNNDWDILYAGFYNTGLRTVQRIQKNTWYHLVWTRNSAGGINDSMTGTAYYINGNPVAMTQDELLLGPLVPAITSSKFRIQKAGNFTRFFSGTLDELALYQRVLSPSEVLSHASAVGCPNCTGDLNHDCLVEDSDFVIFAAAYNLLVCDDPAMPEGCPSDFNHDGTVDDSDFVLFIGAYNTLLCE